MLSSQSMKKHIPHICASLFLLLALGSVVLRKKEVSTPVIAPVVAAEEIKAEPVADKLPTIPSPAVTPVAKKPVTVARKKLTPKPAATPTPLPPPAPVPAPVPTCESRTFNQQFLCLINDHRRDNGLGSVSLDSLLTATALDHSVWMSVNSSMSHTGENNSNFSERCQAHSTVCDAENIALGYTTAQKLFTAWKNSPGHNANMLGSHTKLGLGISAKYATLVLK